jgi:hypothetical protein
MSSPSQQHLERAMALLGQIGAADTEHPSGTLLKHLRGTYDILEGWSCPEYLCLAGLYHSVYGTETFRTETIPLDARDQVREAIGERAEEIAFLYCAIRRSSLYENLEHGAPGTLEGRNGERRPIGGVGQLADLMTLDLANRIEQVGEVSFSDARVERDRRIYERAVPLLPPTAVASLRSSFPRRSKAQLAARRVARAVGRLKVRIGARSSSA